MKTLIRNATVVTPRETLQTSVLLDGPKIAAIDVAPQTTADEIVDGTGLLLLPGVIDDQVHFREPGLTHKGDIHSESRAAAAGGVTSFMDMPNTVPQTTTNALLREKQRIGSENSVVNFSFYLGAANNNLSEILNADPVEVCGI